MKAKLGVNMLDLGSGNIDVLRDPSHPPRIAVLKVGNSCSDSTLAHQVHVRPKFVNLQADDRGPPV